MAAFKVVVSDPGSGRTTQLEVDGQDANRFLGRELGEELDAGPIGLGGATLKLTGGSDRAGRPLRGDVEGDALTERLSTGGVGYRPTRAGERKRITVRGREISDDVAQINAMLVETGDADVEAIFETN